MKRNLMLITIGALRVKRYGKQEVWTTWLLGIQGTTIYMGLMHLALKKCTSFKVLHTTPLSPDKLFNSF